MASGTSALAAVNVDQGRRPGRVVLRLRMPSRRDAIVPTVDRVIEWTSAVRLDGDQRANLAVALSEALSNAVVHGNVGCPEKPVRVVVGLEPGRGIVIDVQDAGPGFNVAALLDCREGERILAPSGRGVFLMRQLVDRVEFNAPGNRVRLGVRARETERS